MAGPRVTVNSTAPKTAGAAGNANANINAALNNPVNASANAQAAQNAAGANSQAAQNAAGAQPQIGANRMPPSSANQSGFQGITINQTSLAAITSRLDRLITLAASQLSALNAATARSGGGNRTSAAANNNTPNGGTSGGGGGNVGFGGGGGSSGSGGGGGSGSSGSGGGSGSDDEEEKKGGISRFTGPLGQFAQRTGQYAGAGTVGSFAGAFIRNPFITGAAALLATPQLAPILSGALLGLSGGYRSDMRSMFAYGRITNTPGDSIRDALHPLSGELPDWMAATGLGPGEAASLGLQYGIGGRTAMTQSSGGEWSGPIAAIRDIALAGNTPGFAGMSLGDVAAYGRMTRSMGLSVGGPVAAGGVMSQTPVGSNVNSMANILTDAVRRGLDASQILRSMETGIQMTARVAPGVSIDTTTGFLNRIMASNMPSARTGELGVSMLGGMQASMDNAHSSPLGQTILYKAVSMSQTRQGLANLIGKDQLAAIESSSAGKEQVERYLKNPWGVAEGSLLLGFMSGTDAWMKATEATVNPILGKGSTAAEVGIGIASGAGVNGRFAYTHPDAGPGSATIMAKLMARGMDKDTAAAFTANFQRESNFNPALRNSSNHVGIAQWSPERQADFKKLTGKDLINATVDEQLDFAIWETKHTESRAMSAINKASGSRAKGFAVGQFYERDGNYAEDQSRGGLADSLADQNIPTNILEAEAAHKQSDFTSGEVSWQEFGNVVTRFDEAVNKFIMGVDTFFTSGKTPQYSDEHNELQKQLGRGLPPPTTH